MGLLMLDIIDRIGYAAAQWPPWPESTMIDGD